MRVRNGNNLLEWSHNDPVQCLWGTSQDFEIVWDRCLQTEGLSSITFWHLSAGTVYECGTEEYESLISPEIRKPGSRAVIVIDVYQCQTVGHPPSSPVSFDLTVPLSHVDMLFHSMTSLPVAPNSSEWLIRKNQLTALQTQRPVKKVSKHIRHDRTWEVWMTCLVYSQRLIPK